MNTFTKYNGQWAVNALVSGNGTGDTVTVDLRNGGTKRVTLGPRLSGAIFAIIPTPVPHAPAPVAVAGDLSRINAMFDRAREHLRHPAIVLDGFRVSVAGARARVPGSLTITSAERGAEGRAWYGRVTQAGEFQPGRDAPPDLADELRRFAADPAGVAAEHGRLHGACCFCNRPLQDERSTHVGYGPICADHFGLPWGRLWTGSLARTGASVTAPIEDAALADARARADRAHTMEEYE